MTKVNICLISLGCEKNLVDSELILGMLKEQKDAQGYLFNIVNDAKDSDVVIINTCGFIESAKREALSVIFDVLALKKEKASLKVVVCGCLVERYLEDLKKDIPEVDLFIPIKDYFRFNCSRLINSCWTFRFNRWYFSVVCLFTKCLILIYRYICSKISLAKHWFSRS